MEPRPTRSPAIVTGTCAACAVAAAANGLTRWQGDPLSGTFAVGVARPWILLILPGPPAGGIDDGNGDAAAVVFVAIAQFIDGGLARGILRRISLRRWDWNRFKGFEPET